MTDITDEKQRVKEELLRLKSKQELLKEKEKLQRLKEEVEPGLLDKAWKVLKGIGDKL